MFKKVAIGAAAFASLAIAAPASAAITVTQTPDPCTVMDPVCTFSFDSNVGAGAFSESANFMLPQMGTTAGALISIAVGNAGNINFSRVFLTDPNAVEYDFAITNGQVDIAQILLNTIAGQYTLTVEGTASTVAGYGGDLTFSAVPEPTAWALFILGFGAVGYTMRRRNSSIRATKASLNFA